MLALWGPDAAQVTQTPDQSLGLPGLSGLVIALAVGSLIFMAWRRRKGILGVRGTTGGAAMGNALMDMNAMFMPNHANAEVVLKLEEEAYEDAAGEGPTPWTPPPAPPESPYRSDDSELLN